MFPHQKIWSKSRINLLQRCQRAFVLRYGLAKLSQHHPQGQLLSQSFDIQSPWILLHQIIRNILLDYAEDYVIGHVWAEGLLKARFREDFTQIIAQRNQLVERINSYNIVSRSQFQRAHAEPHLIEMGIQICLSMLHHQTFRSFLKEGTIQRREPTTSIKKEQTRIYSSPDLIHKGKNGTTLIKIHLIGHLTSFDRQHQSSLLQLYGDGHSSVIIFQLERRSWHVHQSIPTKAQRSQAMQLVEMDIQRMEDAYTSIGKRNDLSKVPLADSYRSCMHCNVKFLCPSRHGLEHAKAEQRSLMCQ